jgi:hypothetical protein
MSEYWRAIEGGKRGSTLNKCQALLTFTGNETLEVGSQPYQDASLTINLRNTLVHFRPQDLSSPNPDKMEERLKGKFAENSTTARIDDPWWPNKCLGWGCARWSIEATTALADYLVSRTGVEPAYVRFRAESRLGDVPPGAD